MRELLGKSLEAHLVLLSWFVEVSSVRTSPNMVIAFQSSQDADGPFVVDGLCPAFAQAASVGP